MKSSEVIAGPAALAQDSRLSIYRLLVKRGPGGYTPGDIAAKLNVPSPTLSFHLKELQRAGLLKVQREGRFLYYSPDFTHMNELLSFLSDNCCVLADKDCAADCIKPAVETAAPKRKRA